jgi:hypothetical protein
VVVAYYGHARLCLRNVVAVVLGLEACHTDHDLGLILAGVVGPSVVSLTGCLPLLVPSQVVVAGMIPDLADLSVSPALLLAWTRLIVVVV